MSLAERILEGRSVLLVEDEAMLAMVLEDRLLDAGSTAVHIFGHVEAALVFLAAHTVDLAIVDVNVAGESGERVGEVLVARGIPFVFSSGYDDVGLDERWRDWPLLRKPYGTADLHAVLLDLIHGTKGTDPV
ncbi:response regulator [Luteibacter rhizovicinus]|nr:response regulator [Luteibacter rhizovicinus]